MLLLEIFVVQSKGDHGRVNSGKKSHVTGKLNQNILKQNISNIRKEKMAENH